MCIISFLLALCTWKNHERILKTNFYRKISLAIDFFLLTWFLNAGRIEPWSLDSLHLSPLMYSHELDGS